MVDIVSQKLILVSQCGNGIWNRHVKLLLMVYKISSQKRRLLDLLAVVLLVLLASYITIFFTPNFLISSLLFFGLPSLYLLARKPVELKKGLYGAFLIGVVWGFSFDYLAEFNHAWGWSINTNLAIPLHILGVVSLDILIWYFLWIFLVIIFYEYFAEHDSSKKISPRYFRTLGIGVIVAVVVVLLSKTAPDLLTFSYTYLILGILTLIPFSVIVIRRPSIFPKVMEIIPFFIFLYLVFELTALRTSLWSFPGQYIGFVNIIGQRFPFEEMIFWIVISSAIAASYHEYVVDDNK